MYKTCGTMIDPNDPSKGTKKCLVSLSDTLEGITPTPKPNTNFYLGTGMIDPTNSAGSWNAVDCDGCGNSTYQVLNFGGWGCCPYTCKPFPPNPPLTSSQGGLCNDTATTPSNAPAQVWGDSDITNIMKAATPERVKARGFNVVSFDIEGVDSSLTAKTLLNAIQLYKNAGILVIITLPGFGVKHYCQLDSYGKCNNKKMSKTTCSDDNKNQIACQHGDHGGACLYDFSLATCSVDPTDTTSLSYKAMEWFTPAVARATDYICLMYYAQINDTETSLGGGVEVVEASLKKWNLPTDASGVGNMKPEQIILGLSLGKSDSPEKYLSAAILNLASGGVSRWGESGAHYTQAADSGKVCPGTVQPPPPPKYCSNSPQQCCTLLPNGHYKNCNSDGSCAISCDVTYKAYDCRTCKHSCPMPNGACGTNQDPPS